MILALLAILLIASFVVCYFSSQYWHWAHVLLVEVIFLASFAYFFAAYENMRIRQVYGQKISALDKQIADIRPLVNALKRGTGDDQVISMLENREEMNVVRDEGEEGRMLATRELEHKLAMVTRATGRVWRDVATVALDTNDPSLTATLRVDFPKPHGIQQGAVLYVFEQGPAPNVGQNGPRYLTEVKVSEVVENQIRVQPTSDLSARDRQRYANTTNTWVLYENMPPDQHPDGVLEIFAGATPEELKQWLPPESVDQYIRHGKPAEPDDDEWHKVGVDADGNILTPDQSAQAVTELYRRPLRDYNLLFQEYKKRYVSMQADKIALTEDNTQLKQSLASAKQVQAAYEARRTKLQFDLAGVTKDRQAIDNHLTQVRTQLTHAEKLISATQAENVRLAEELAVQ